MQVSRVIVLGCGYTGRRVARRLLESAQRRAVRLESDAELQTTPHGAGSVVREFLRSRIPVTATTRHPDGLADLAAAGASVIYLDALELDSLRVIEALGAGAAVLHSIPVLQDGGRSFDPTPRLLAAFRDPPVRVAYLSTTGVYGETVEVDESTLAAPRSEHDRLRLAAEEAVLTGSWSGIVLRPGAIYGPGRGVHESLREGRFRLVDDGCNYVSRIHVEDLAALTEAALLSGLTGAWPVADEEPCTAREMALFCSQRLAIPFPPSMPRASAHHTRRANRKVDGSAIFRRLGVTLRYPSYREGVPASL